MNSFQIGQRTAIKDTHVECFQWIYIQLGQSIHIEICGIFSFVKKKDKLGGDWRQIQTQKNMQVELHSQGEGGSGTVLR